MCLALCVEVCIGVRTLDFAHGTQKLPFSYSLKSSYGAVPKCKMYRILRALCVFGVYVCVKEGEKERERCGKGKQMRDRFVIGDSFKSAMVLGFEVLGC